MATQTKMDIPRNKKKKVQEKFRDKNENNEPKEMNKPAKLKT